jgi:hypothetical protein
MRWLLWLKDGAKVLGFGLLIPTVLYASAVLAFEVTGRPVAAPRFVDVATPEMADADRISDGACWGDIDGNGELDLVVAQHGASRLWRQEGGRFTDVAGESGILTGRRRDSGCSVIDIDNDGDLDLFVTSRDFEGTSRGRGPGRSAAAVYNRLFLNKGDGHFEDVTTQARVQMVDSGAASADWADYDNDGDYDGFVAARWGPKRRVNGFFEQIAPARFTNLAAEKGLASPIGVNRYFLGNWFDYDGDGDPDLIFANEFWGAEIFENRAGDFTRVTTEVLPMPPGSSEGAPPRNAMGVGWGDYDQDGCMDVFVTGINTVGQGGFEARSLSHLPSRLYRSRCNGTFEDGTEAARLPVTGVVEWGANFIDFDNDGDLDLSVVAGNANQNIVETYLGFARRAVTFLVTLPRSGISYRAAVRLYRYEAMIPPSGTTGVAAAMPNFLYQNMLMETGRPVFMDVTEKVGAANFGATRGSAWADFDNDGDLDWFLPNRRTPSRLFRNDGPVGQYLRVHVVGARLRDGVGTLVKIKAGGRVQLRHVHVLGGYLSQSQMDPHFGLGSADRVDEVWVRWPGSTAWVLACSSVPANSTVTITEGGGCRW